MALTFQKAGNHDDAVRLFRNAAQHGHPGAMNELGVCLMESHEKAPLATDASQQEIQDRETEQEEARILFHEAAKAGHTAAMYNFSLMCKQGQGGPIDHNDFLVWCTKAAHKGYLKAHVRLGEYYAEYGRTQKDRLFAVHHFSFALAHGENEAQEGFTKAIANLT